jgi:general secretion pathway protein I
MSASAEHRRQPGRARGFTLIEVLAALVIVALGMLGVIQAVTQTARNGVYLREKTLAHWIAMNVITEHRLLSAPPDVSESSDEVDFAGQRWLWTMTVTQTEVESLRRMDVAVRLADRPEGEALTTVTGFYGTAIGAVGGSSLPWLDAGVQNGGDDGDDQGNDANDGDAEQDSQPNTDETPSQGRRDTPRDRAREEEER